MGTLEKGELSGRGIEYGHLKSASIMGAGAWDGLLQN